MIDLLSVKNKTIGTYVTPNPPHHHTAWELIIFEKGAVKNYVDNVSYDAGPSSVFLLGPMHLHAIKLLDSDHLHKDIYAETDELESLLAIFPEDFRNDVLSGNVCVNFKLDVQDFNAIINKIHKIETLSLIKQTHENSPIQIKPLTLSLIQYVLSIYLTNSYSQTNIYPEWLLTFLRKLSDPQQFTKDVNELIAETNYSHTQFSKIFKKYCECSLIEYLKELRLSHAATLLSYSDYSTLFICETCGYDSYSYFERIFKQKYHCTPQQFRKNANRKNWDRNL